MKQRNLRKRKATEAYSTDEDEEAAASIRARLEDTKLLQKQRARALGVNAEILLHPPDVASIEEIAPTNEPSNDLLEAYVKEKAVDPATEDPEMEKYIEQQLARRLGKSKAAKPAEPGVQRTDEDDLYVIPEGLQGQQSKLQDVSSWMTGIVEVPLSLEHKLRNIEETEAAKRRMLKGGMSAVGHGDEEDEDTAPKDVPKVTPRIAYPRDFGKEKAKEIEFRENALKEGPRKEWKKKQQQQRDD